MKKIFFSFIFTLCLVFSLVATVMAADTENTYYVVQSDGSDVALALTAEGKSVVSIDKLYSSYGESTKADSTYFISQFDGQVLNLILAENVSYAMSTNPSNPTGSGIRLDKAVTMNVYFNGHYWWIPDDNRYAGFFINNQGAHLSLIGDRTVEEVSASFNLSSVNAKTTSNAVDYYGGYIGFYIEKGDLTIKNAVIIGEDEVIYQKDNNASGTTTLTLDTCMVNNKDKSCRTIVLRSEGKASVTVQFNHAYVDKAQIHNMIEGSYINNSKMALLYTDSWLADTHIGKVYFYVNDSAITEYTSAGDVHHMVAKNSSFNKIDLIGDASGGAYATLIGSTYNTVNLKRKSASRNGTLYVATEADCYTAATRTVYTYDDSTSSIISYVDNQYPLDNPAKGHKPSGEMLSISYEGYLERGDGVYVCAVCGEEYLEKGVLEPLFSCLGYSVFEGGSGSFAVGYMVNVDALARYSEVTGNGVTYGIFVVLKDKIGTGDLFSADGETAAGVVSADVSGYNVQAFELKVTGILETQRNVMLAMGAYVRTEDKGGVKYSYLQNSAPLENEKYEFISYNEILDRVMEKEVASLEDMVVEYGQPVELAKTVNVRGEERELTYSFEGNGISIENYTLTGLIKKSETTVIAKAKGFTGTFKVQVKATVGENYKYVVVIGVDGAGAYFKDADTPNIDAIFGGGAVTYNCLTSDPTISAQCWGSLMHGVTPSVHGLTNDIVSSTAYSNRSKYPSFFRVIRENDENAVLASFCNWNPINVGIVEDGIGVHKVGGMSDSKLTAEIVAYLENNNPTAMFVQFDEADGAGHSTGYGNATQLAKISEIDGYIGQIYAAYEKSGILDETLFIVTADHGGSGTNHGGLTDSEKYVMFAATGNSVQNGEIEDMEIRDTAAVVLMALGYECPETWTARVPSGLFNGVVAEERPVYVDKESGRYHETEATPEKDSQGYVTNFVNGHELSTYFTFDGDITDEMGGSTKQGGTLSYEDAYFGQGVVLDKGYVSLSNYTPGTDSFTFAFWIKKDNSSGEDPCVFSNKNWQTGKNTGLAFTIRSSNDVRLNFGDGSNRVDCDVKLPTNYKEGWMHVIAIVDRENNKIGVCIDFQTVIFVDIPDSLKADSLDTSYSVLNIGQDGTGRYGISLDATLDEFMIFEGAFDQEDVYDLAAYYDIYD